MRYYDDMINKYGFDFGHAVPPDAEACRTLYVRAINAVAASRSLPQRAAAYDRRGHNSCMLVYYLGTDMPQGYDATSGHLPSPDATPMDADESMQEVLDAVNELHVDQYVRVRVTVQNRAFTHAMAAHLAPLRTR